MEKRAPRNHRFALPFLALFAICAICAICAGCHAHAKPAPAPTFHYRSQAHAWPLDKGWSTNLNGNDPARGTDAVRVHLDQPGLIQVSSTAGSSNIAVMIFMAGKKPLKQARAGGTVSVPVAAGDVFVVVHALKGSGPGAVQLVASFAPPAPAEPAGTSSAESPTAGAPAATASAAPPTIPGGEQLEPGMAVTPKPAPASSDPNELPLPADNDLPLDDL